MGYVPQESNLIPELSVRDNLLLWYRDKYRLKKELEEGFLHTLGVHQMCSMRAQNLSGGMKEACQYRMRTGGKSSHTSVR